MKITEDEEKEVLRRRITLESINPKTNERITGIFQHGLVEFLFDLDKRLTKIENKYDKYRAR